MAKHHCGIVLTERSEIGLGGLVRMVEGTAVFLLLPYFRAEQKHCCFMGLILMNL